MEGILLRYVSSHSLAVLTQYVTVVVPRARGYITDDAVMPGAWVCFFCFWKVFITVKRHVMPSWLQCSSNNLQNVSRLVEIECWTDHGKEVEI